MSFQVDAYLPPGIRAAAESARKFEALGYDGLWVAETQSNPFMDLAVPAVETSRPVIGTNVAIAFARSPFVTATAAWQLQDASKGRFILGLGAQVKGHIERRFGMPFESPGPKLREYVQAVRAIWDAFAGKERLNFRGKFYTHTVLTPFFDPGPIGYDPPPIYMAAVNEYNCETVGMHCDGLLVHPLHTRKYLDEVVLPAVDRGLAKSGRTRADLKIAIPVFVAVGRGDPAWEAADAFVRSQAAFYGSTRTYRGVFDTHGWSETPDRLHHLMGRGEIAAMAAEITDEMVDEIAITGDPDEIASALQTRYGGLADRVFLYNLFTSPWSYEDDKLAKVIDELSSSP